MGHGHNRMLFAGHSQYNSEVGGGGKRQHLPEFSMPAWCCSARRIRVILVCFIAFNVVILLLAAINSGTVSRVGRGGGLWTELCQHCGGSGHDRDASYRDIAMDIFHLPLLENADMGTHYYPLPSAGNPVGKWCFRQGTLPLADSEKAGKCLCANAYHGADCGIPQVVWNSSFLEAGTRQGAWVRRRVKPRRLLSISTVTGPAQLDFLRLHIAYLQPIVDVFVIADKTNRLLADIERTFGGQEEYTKIVYLPLNNHNNSTATAEDMLQHLFWKRLSDFRLDDLLVWADLTTVPLAEVLLFLKLYDGYSEPVYLNVRQLAYSFLWEQKPDLKLGSLVEPNQRSQTPFISSFAVLSVLCRYNLTCAMPPKTDAFTAAQLDAFMKNHGWAIEHWTLGTSEKPSGWNCKNCVTFPDSSSLFPEGSMNGSTVTNEKWQITLLNKLKENGFSLETVQPVDKRDLRYLAPGILLEKPGSLWYLVPLHLKIEK